MDRGYVSRALLGPRVDARLGDSLGAMAAALAALAAALGALGALDASAGQPPRVSRCILMYRDEESKIHVS